MALADMHPEDVKAELRKRFGTVSAFEEATGLPPKSVYDCLRGRSSKRVALAVSEAIKTPIITRESEHSDCSSEKGRAHRLNAGVR